MGIFSQFPYSNFHDMNMDEILKIMREMQDEWAATKTEWASYKDYIDNYFNNLDVSEEVLEALQRLALDGTLNTIMDPVIVAEVNSWLDEHVTPTTPVIDSSLSIEDAAAEARATGANIKSLSGMDLINPFVSITGSYFDYNDGTIKPSDTYNRSELIPIDPAYCIITLTSTNTGNWDDRYNCWYDENHDFISNFRYPRPDGTVILDPPENARYMGISCKNEVTLELDIKYKSKADLFELNNKNILRHDHNIAANGVTILTGADFEQGAITSEGQDNPDIEGQQGRVRTIGFIPVEENTLYIFSAIEWPRVQFAVSFFTDNKPNSKRFDTTDWIDTYYNDFGVFITPANTKYIRITMKRGVSPVSPEYLKDFVITLYKSSANLCDAQSISFGYGAIYANSPDLNRSATGWIYSQPLTDGFIHMGSGLSCVIKLYNNDTYLGKINTLNQVDQIGGNWQSFTGIIDVKALCEQYNATHLIFSAKCHDTPFTSENYKAVGKRIGYYKSIGQIPQYSNDHAINYEAFILSPVKVQSVLVKLLGYQAFCIYNNKLYSTDGTALYEQDIDSSSGSAVTMALGHGNSIQTGSNGHAFVSGWDDGIVYEVDLNTKTLVDTYQLPVSGYTTVAVDDINNLMYIFYRASYPDTVAPYELITYNYDTGSIVSRKTIDSFKAMQACQFINNRILVIDGLSDGSAELKVYNTNGDIVTRYDIGILKDQEPEGICYNPDTHEIWISTVSAMLYKLTV